MRSRPHLWYQGYWLVYLVWFFALERVVTQPQFIVHCRLDDVIPFCEWFALPYCSWFFLLAASLLYLWLNDTPSYDRLCAMMFSGMTFCLVVYMLLPTGLALRPAPAQVAGRDNPALALMRLLWAADPPLNVCPSIHCQTSAAMALALAKSRPLRQRPWARRGVWAWAALICVSTLFTKQHSAVDVALGVALVLPWWWALYRRGAAARQRA